MQQAKRSPWIIPAMLAYLGGFQVALAFFPQLMSVKVLGVGIGLSPVRIRPSTDTVDVIALALGAALLALAAVFIAQATWRRPIYWQIWIPLFVGAPVFAGAFTITTVLTIDPDLAIRHQAPTLSVAERQTIRPCLEAQQHARASLGDLRLAIRRCEEASQTVDPQSEAAHLAARYITRDYRRLDRFRQLGVD